MLSVALVNIPQSIEERYGSLTGLSPELPLLGPAFLARYLGRNGYDVSLFDHVNLTMAQSLGVLRRFDVVGISTYIVNYEVAKRMAKELRRFNPEVIIVFGGPHATLFPSDFNGSEVDYLVAGEGEIPMLEILRAIDQGREPADMPGLYRREGGTLQGRGKAEIVSDLDDIGEPDVGQYNLNSYHPPAHVLGRKVVHTLTSRGCPFKCSFCAASELMQRRIRYRSVDSVMRELWSYRNMGYDSVIFYDDIFTLHKNRVYELCNAMVESGLGMRWACFTRTQCVDADLCRAMKRAGCYLVTFGCESFNDKTLKLLRKGLTSDVNVKGVIAAYEGGVLANSSFMVGLPGETAEDIERTIGIAMRSKLTFGVFPIFEPFKGTPIYEVCKERGSWQALEGQGNALLPSQKEVWVPDTLSRDQVVRLAGKAFFLFYFYPPRMLRILRYLLLSMPPRRSWKFFKGGLAFFVNIARRKSSQHMTHY